jgi:uroporphyrinogen-III synthase
LTRTAEDNAALAPPLAAAGLTVIDYPCLALAPVLPPLVDLVATAGLGPFGAIAFTSPRAVAAFLDQAAVREHVGLWSDPALLAAVGPGTAQALADRGHAAGLVADPPTGAGLAAGLGARLPPGTAVLLPAGDRLRSETLDALTAAGLVPVPLTVYAHQSVAPAPLPLPPPDVVVCASPSAARTFVRANPDLAEVRFVAIGPTTASALAELGARQVTVARQPNAAALIAAVQATVGH